MKETLTCMICLANHVRHTLALAGSARECRYAQSDKRGAGNFLLLFYLSNLLHRASDELHQLGLHLYQHIKRLLILRPLPVATRNKYQGPGSSPVPHSAKPGSKTIQLQVQKTN
jgi:hypothetical protein